MASSIARCSSFPARDMPNDGLPMTRMPDANPQAVKVLTAERGTDIAHAIVSAVAATRLQAHDTGIEIQFIVGDQQLRW